MLIPGLVSVTFRKKTPEEIINIAEDCSLKAIEWGADVHAVIGDTGNSARIGKMTRDVGISPISLGSYYWIGYKDEKGSFGDVIKTAEALGTHNIRSWAGRKASAEVDDAEFKTIAKDIAKICDIAAEGGMTLSLEYHPNTLTDNRKSAVRLASEIARDNLRLYWQPDFTLSDKENLESLKAVLPWLGNIHVFSWLGAGAARYPLSHSRDLFKAVAEIAGSDGRDHGLLLEFVKDDSEAQLREDAAELIDLIGG